MKGYMDRVNALRDQVYATQAELESRNKEVKKMQEKFEEWQDYISIFDVQLHTKIVELDIEKEEL